MPKKVNNLLIPIVVLAHLISALYYLSVPEEIKNAKDLKHWYALWFFGSEYLFFTAILYLSTIRITKTKLEIKVLYAEMGHLLIRAVLYSLHYAGILYTDSRHRLSYLLAYIFLSAITILRKELFSTCTDKN